MKVSPSGHLPPTPKEIRSDFLSGEEVCLSCNGSGCVLLQYNKYGYVDVTIMPPFSPTEEGGAAMLKFVMNMSNVSTLLYLFDGLERFDSGMKRSLGQEKP